MSPKDRDENAKNPRWQTPMDLPTAGKNAYNATMDQSGGAQDAPQAPGAAGAKVSSDPAGKNLQDGTDRVRHLAEQTGRSG